MTHVPDLSGLTEALDAALPGVWSILRDATSEPPYLFEIVHSGTSPGYLLAAGSWEHGLPSRACELAAHRRIPLEAATALERWESTFEIPESKKAFQAANDRLLPAGDVLDECMALWDERQSDHDDEPPDDDGLDPFLHAVLRACGESMSRLDHAGLFGRGGERESRVIGLWVNDSGRRHRHEWVERLNPSAACERFALGAARAEHVDVFCRSHFRTHPELLTPMQPIDARQFLADPDPVLRATCAWVLARAADVGSLPIARLLDDPEPWVRATAGWVVLGAGCGDAAHARAAIEAALADPDPTVRRSATWAAAACDLTLLPVQSSLVARLVDEADTLVRLGAALALLRSREPGTATEWLDVAERAAKQAPAGLPRSLAIGACAALGEHDRLRERVRVEVHAAGFGAAHAETWAKLLTAVAGEARSPGAFAALFEILTTGTRTTRGLYRNDLDADLTLALLDAITTLPRARIAEALDVLADCGAHTPDIASRCTSLVASDDNRVRAAAERVVTRLVPSG